MRSKALIVLVCGISISFLFFSLALNLLNTRNKAQKIAIKLTADLQKSESRFRNMIANNQSIMLLIDPVNGDIIEANQAASVFYGYTLNHLCSLKIFDINISPISLIEEELKSTQMGFLIIIILPINRHGRLP
jgi:PAS domain-containing protein